MNLNLYPIMEVKVAVDLEPRVPYCDLNAMKAATNDKKQDVLSGLAKAKEWFDDMLHSIDPLLRHRWDHELGKWVIERFSSYNRAWITVTTRNTDCRYYLSGEDAFTAINDLKEGDLRRYSSPLDRLNEKREAARKVREARQRARIDRIVGIIDGMSDAQVKQFIQVERAFHTGETIIAHGEDLKFLERAHQAGRVALANGEPLDVDPRLALNPGMDPRIYRRKKGEGRFAGRLVTDADAEELKRLVDMKAITIER